MRLYACCGLLLCPAYPQHFAHGYVDKIPGYPGRAGTLTGLHPMQVCRCRVQVLAVVPGREIESRDRIAKICDNFAISKVARDMEQLLATKNLEKPLEQPENGYTYKATWFMQFRAVLWRSWLSVLKEPLLVKVRLIQTTVSGSSGNK